MLNVNFFVLTEERFHGVRLKCVGRAVCAPVAAAST